MANNRQLYQPNITPGRVYLCDIRTPAFKCCPDVIGWLQVHGISWQEFRDNGASFEVLEATNDAMALKAIEFAKAREAKQNNEVQE